MKRFGVFLAVAGVIVIVSFGTWWLGPWSRPYRYGHMGLLQLKRVTESHPDDFPAWRAIGLRLAADGDGVAADVALQQALRLEPQDAECATALGEIMMASERIPEAFQLLRSTVEAHPKYSAARMALGRLYMRRASYLNATKQFEAITQYDPSNTDAWYQAARCYLQMQQVQNAKDCIDRANRLTPNSTDIVMVYAAIESATGRVESAVALAKQATKLAPNNVKTHIGLANLLLAQHRTDADLESAAQEIAEIERIQPKTPVLPFQKGELARRQNRFADSAKYLEEALRATPGMDEVYYSLGQVYMRLGRKADSERANRIFQERTQLKRQIDGIKIALGGNPDNHDLLVNLAELQIQAGNTPAAIANVRTVLAANPKNPRALALVKKYRGGLPPTQPQ